MRVYADSSFILRLLTRETDSEEAIAEYRRLGYPCLLYLPLHALEVRNAIFQRAFYQRRSLPSGARQHVARERDATLARLDVFISRRALLDVTVDMESTLLAAGQLSKAHTERFGARAIDLLHVACAQALESELFLTADKCQARLAKAEGIKAAIIN